MAETEVEILNIDTSKSTKSIKELRQEIKDLKDQLVNLDRGTEAYNKTLLELGNKTHELKEIQEEIARTTSDFGDKLSNVRGVIGGLSGAFQTVLGSLSLMGVQIGDDVKMLKMLQSAMAITQGIAAIDAGVKSFKALTVAIKASTVAMSGLKKALVTTGIGALVVGIGVLISKLTDLEEASEETFNKMSFDIENVRNGLYGTESSLSRIVRLMKAFGMSEKEIEDFEIEHLSEYIVKLRQAIDDGIEIYQNTTDKNKQKEILTYLDAMNTELAEKENELQEKLADAYANTAIRFIESEKAKLEAAKEAAKKAAELRKKELKEIQDYNTEALYATISEEDAEVIKLTAEYDKKKLLFEKYKEDTKLIDEQYKKELQAIRDKYANERMEKELEDEERELELWRRRSESLVNRTEQDAKLQEDAYIKMQNKKNELMAKFYEQDDGNDSPFSLDKYYREEAIDRAETLMEKAYLELIDKKIELQKQLLESGELTAEDYIAAQDMLLTLQKERAEKSVEIEKKALDRRIQLNENYKKAIGSITDSIASILGSVGETLEQGSEEWKAVMTTKAIISTIKGGVDAYMGMIEAIPGPAGIAAGALAAAATVAAGMAEVSKIQNTDISTSGSSGSTSTSTSLGSVNATAVQVAATQVTNTRQTPTTRDVEELPAQQVYVLEGDISRAQNNVRVTVEQATH